MLYSPKFPRCLTTKRQSYSLSRKLFFFFYIVVKLSQRAENKQKAKAKASQSTDTHGSNLRDGRKKRVMTQPRQGGECPFLGYLVALFPPAINHWHHGENKQL